MNKVIFLIMYFCLLSYGKDNLVHVLLVGDTENSNELRAFQILESKLIRWLQNYFKFVNKDTLSLNKHFVTFERSYFELNKITSDFCAGAYEKKIYELEELLNKKIGVFKFRQILGLEAKRALSILAFLKWKIGEKNKAEKLLLEAFNISPKVRSDFMLCESGFYAQEFMNSEFFKSILIRSSKNRFSIWINSPNDIIRINNFVVLSNERVELSPGLSYFVDYSDEKDPRFSILGCNENGDFQIFNIENKDELLFIHQKRNMSKDTFLLVELVNHKYKFYFYTKNYSIDEIYSVEPVTVESLLKKPLRKINFLYPEKLKITIKKHLNFNLRKNPNLIERSVVINNSFKIPHSNPFLILATLGFMTSFIHLIGK